MRLSLLAVFALCIAASSRANAEETTYSLGAGYSFVSGEQNDGHGGVLSLDYERELTDGTWFHLGAEAGMVRTPGNELGYVGRTSVGFNYLFDVLKYVPYASVCAGFAVTEGSLGQTVRPALEAGAGIEWLTSPESSRGIFARGSALFGDTAMVVVGVRMTWRRGYF